jgi:hypothetical protein
MLYANVTEVTRGTAHPESQAPQTLPVALSSELGSSVTKRGPTPPRPPLMSAGFGRPLTGLYG